MFTQFYKDIDELHKLIATLMRQTYGGYGKANDAYIKLWELVAEAISDIHPSM